MTGTTDNVTMTLMPCSIMILYIGYLHHIYARHDPAHMILHDAIKTLKVILDSIIMRDMVITMTL